MHGNQSFGHSYVMFSLVGNKGSLQMRKNANNVMSGVSFSFIYSGGAWWPSDRVSDSRVRGRGSIPTSAVLCP